MWMTRKKRGYPDKDTVVFNIYLFWLVVLIYKLHRAGVLKFPPD